MQNIFDFIIKHEGLKLKPYRCPAGKLTIGVGRNIEDNGISRNEAMIMLENDIFRCIDELTTIFGSDFKTYPVKVQTALIDMIFNLGKTRFMKFHHMIKAIKNQDWDRASKEAVNSKWCKDVGNRCKDVAEYLKG